VYLCVFVCVCINVGEYLSVCNVQVDRDMYVCMSVMCVCTRVCMNV
jgi:hypothetical protein